MNGCFQTILKEAQLRLRTAGIENAANEARWLVAHVQEEFATIDSEAIDGLMSLLTRRVGGEPLDYLVGHCHFFGADLSINPSVLIPRSETEWLAEKIFQSLKGSNLTDKVLWDLCTGSGAIAISLKKRLPALTIRAADLSSEALGLACENGRKNGVDITWLQGDLFEPLKDQTCDFFVANPPYVSEEEYEHLDKSVKDFEPKMALVASSNGLEFYEKIATQLMQFLRPNGIAWLEIGKNQASIVCKLFLASGFAQVTVEKDLSGHDRYIILNN